MAFSFLTLMWVQFNITINGYKANMSKEKGTFSSRKGGSFKLKWSKRKVHQVHKVIKFIWHVPEALHYTKKIPVAGQWNQ